MTATSEPTAQDRASVKQEQQAQSFMRFLRSSGMSLDTLPSTISAEDWVAFARQIHGAGYLSGYKDGGAQTVRDMVELADIPPTLAQINNRIGELLERFD